MKNTLFLYLRKSEKYFKTDMVYLFTGGFWLLVGQGVSTATAILLAIAFANLLPQEIYGTYKYVIAVAGILAAFSLTGARMSLTRAIAHQKDGTLPFLFKKKLQWSILVFLGGAILGVYYYVLQDNTILGFSVLLAGTFSPFIQSASLYNQFLSGQKKFKVLMWCNSIYAVIPALALFLTVLLTTNVAWVLGTYFIINSFVNVFIYLVVKRRYSRNNDIDFSTLSYAKHSSLINILGKITVAFDSIIVYHFLGAAQLAIYTFAMLVPNEVLKIVRKVAPLVAPKLAERSAEQLKAPVMKKTLLLSTLLIPIAAAYYLLAPILFHLLLPNYSESIPYTRLAILIILTANYIPGTVFDSQRALKESYIFKITNNVSLIVFMVILFFPFGLWGLIMGRVIGRFFTFGLGLLLISRMKNSPQTTSAQSRAS